MVKSNGKEAQTRQSNSPDKIIIAAINDQDRK